RGDPGGSLSRPRRRLTHSLPPRGGGAGVGSSRYGPAIVSLYLEGCGGVMRARLCFALVLGALLPVGCGAAPPPVAPATPAVTPEQAGAATTAPPAGANHAILVALAPGSVPQTVAARILG